MPFELELNDLKSAVRLSHDISYDSWRYQIRSILPAATDAREKFEFYFDAIKSLSKDNPGSNVYAYAIRRASSAFVNAEQWSVVENFLLLSCRREPTLVQLVVGVIVNRDRLRHDVNKQKMRDFLKSNIRRLVEIGHYGELSWLLYACISLKLEISSRDISALFDESDPIVALTICHLNSVDLISGKIKKSHWNSFLTADGLKGSMWLYAYEATLKKWTGIKSDTFVKSDLYFNELYKRKVSFYEIDAQVEDIDALRIRALARNKRQNAIFRDYSDDFEFDIDDLELDWEDTDEFY